MRWKVHPEDFVVEELIEIPLRSGGPYTPYRVRKWGRTTLEVQAELAARLGVPQRAVVFPALKDRMALAVQMAGVRGPGFEAVRVGEADRPPGPHDLWGNRFTVRLQALTEAEQERLPRDLKRLAEEGFSNYFDDQQFGSWSPEGGFLGRFLLLGQAEEVLRRYLTVPTRADPSAVRAFKARARSLGGAWAAMFPCAPRPSTYRSLPRSARQCAGSRGAYGFCGWMPIAPGCGTWRSLACSSAIPIGM